MEIEQVFGLAISGICIVGIIVCLVLNKDLLHYSNFVKPILKALLTAIQAFSTFKPNNALLGTISTALITAIEATAEAEELWMQDEILKSDRNQWAQKYIANKLDKAGITITTQLEAIINGTIAVVCFLLPHENKEES